MQKTLQNFSKVFPLSSFTAQKVEFQSRKDGLKEYMEFVQSKTSFKDSVKPNQKESFLIHSKWSKMELGE